VHLGIGRDRDVERRHLLEPRDQLGGVGIAARVRLVILPRLGRVAAQRDQVPHPDVPIAARDFVDLLARRSDAGQMGGRGQLGFGDDPLDGGVGALAGRAAGAVGHRHKARPERRQRLDRPPQRFGHRFGLGREKFEADGDVAARFREQWLVDFAVAERVPVHAARRWR
jgi:hypothetical protein